MTKTKDKPQFLNAPPGGVGEISFKIRSYPFGELAQMYYPDHNYQSALRHFREEMHLTRGMWPAMQAVGYKENTKTLTRAQVRTIVQFLGEP